MVDRQRVQGRGGSRLRSRGPGDPEQECQRSVRRSSPAGFVPSDLSGKPLRRTRPGKDHGTAPPQDDPGRPPVNYLDTSALIKRFVAEKGPALVRTLVTGDRPIATANIAYAEVYAGRTRKRREGHLTEGQYALACRQFERHWQNYLRLDLRDEILLPPRVIRSDAIRSEGLMLSTRAP